MKVQIRLAVILGLCVTCAQGVHAAEPAPPPPAQGVVQPDFSPPPVPGFMLRKPDKPLTLEEMQQQADEASRRARAERDKHASPQKSPTKDCDERTK